MLHTEIYQKFKGFLPYHMTLAIKTSVLTYTFTLQVNSFTVLTEDMTVSLLPELIKKVGDLMH